MAKEILTRFALTEVEKVNDRVHLSEIADDIRNFTINGRRITQKEIGFVLLEMESKLGNRGIRNESYTDTTEPTIIQDIYNLLGIEKGGN